MKFLLSSILPLCAVAFAPSTTYQNHAITANNIINNQNSITQLNAAIAESSGLITEELPEKLYFPKAKEFPKVLGGIKIGTRKLTVITGASSGLGLNTAKALVDTGRHFVVMAVRDVEKGKRGTMEKP